MAAIKPTRGRSDRAPVTIIIRRDEGEEPAHHGGAWKVAYADFVTAMMAFFLLMWLMNATTETQRVGLADYFAPTNLFGRSTSGSGQPFGGQTPNDAGDSASNAGSPEALTGHEAAHGDVAEVASDQTAQEPMPADSTTAAAAAQGGTQPDGQVNGPAPLVGKGPQAMIEGGDYAAARLTPAAAEAERYEAAVKEAAQHEQQFLEQAGARLLDAIRRDPALQDAADQLMVDIIPEGLRIQVVDAERQPMFALGSAAPTRRVRDLMQKVVPALSALSYAISIAGHTDSLTFRGPEKGNWELSTERANATRRVLVEAGLNESRIMSITGNADRDLLVPSDPLSPANRRISIIVLRQTGADRSDAVTK